MVKRSVIYFNANLSRIATSPKDFLHRFNLYAQYLRKVSSDGEISIRMILGGPPVSFQGNTLKVTSLSKNPLTQFTYLYRELKKIKGPKTLISGDVDFSLLICLIVKSFVSQVGVQIYIHGSYDSIFLAKGVKAILKRRLLLLGISQAKTVRIVSESDLGKFQSLVSGNSSKLFVSPIPIQLPSKEVDLSRKSKIALVGRLHKERGLSEFVEIFQKLEEGVQTQELLIVGGGPEEAWLRKQLDLCSRTNTRFLGHLDQDDLSMLWGDIKVLVSCAPQESYGMALREAVANGSFVIAKKNETTISLAKLYPELISTYSNPDEGASLIYERLLMTPPSEAVERIGESLYIQQDSYLVALATSWIS